MRGNLVVNALVENPGTNSAKGKAGTNRRRASAGSLPVIPYEITAPE